MTTRRLRRLVRQARPGTAAGIVLVLLSATGFGAFTVSKRVVDDQEQRLLVERAAEVEALLSNSIDSVESSLRVLGPIGASAEPAADALFADSASRVLEGNAESVGVAVRDGDVLTVTAVVGDRRAVGGVLADGRAALARRALGFDEPQLVTDLISEAGETRLVLARRVRGLDAVAFQESVVTARRVAPSTPESPFRGLRVAVYASPVEDPDRLVVSTSTDLPWPGRSEAVPFAVGADDWLLMVGARDPLMGSFPHVVPWLLLSGGILSALLVAAVIETVARRRSYAEAIVVERTGALEETLGKLGEAQTFLERLLTAGPVLVVRLVMPDRQVTYVSSNIDMLFGITPQQAHAPGFLRTMVHRDDVADVDSVLRRIETGDSVREVVEYRIVLNHHGSRWVSAVFVPEISDGQVPAVLGYIVDIDDRRKAERAQREAQHAAETANRAKSEFMSRMSHELRTPLNSVLGFAQLLEIDSLTDPQRDAVNHILKGGRHLLDLINEVLDISRIEAGGLKLSPEPVLAADLVDEAVDLIRPLADQRGIQLVVDRSDGCQSYVFADRQRVKQVLLNLLSNAVKYNRPHGTVALSCDQPAATSVQISVTDTGVGIPAERLGLLFTPFERLGAEHTSEEGTGIGLALSLKLAQAMGGTLTATSKLGRGSTFIVELPRVEGPVQRYERLNGPPEPVEATVGVGRRVVLHVEDNLSNLTLIERILAQRTGIQVVAAMHGRLGLELARQHQPALILLDLHLPDMGGEHVLQRLRDDPATSTIPVVIISADATPGHMRRLLSAGATAYLTKPIDVRELLRVLDDAIADR